MCSSHGYSCSVFCRIMVAFTLLRSLITESYYCLQESTIHQKVAMTESISLEFFGVEITHEEMSHLPFYCCLNQSSLFTSKCHQMLLFVFTDESQPSQRSLSLVASEFKSKIPRHYEQEESLNWLSNPCHLLISTVTNQHSFCHRYAVKIATSRSIGPFTSFQKSIYPWFIRNFLY